MKNSVIFVRQLIIINSSLLILASCSLQKKISKSQNEFILKDPSLNTAHVGISIFEPATNKYWYNYQGDHYFVPASNTKIPTCYAAMKYLEDSLTGILKAESDTAVFILPTGDPTLLHPDFKTQPIVNFLQNTNKKIYTTDVTWKEEPLGSGWAWNDYNDDYMAERSPLPVYGNVIKWIMQSETDGPIVYSIPEVNWKVNFDTGRARNFFVQRVLNENIYKINQGTESLKQQYVPFVTNGIGSALELLSDTIHKSINLASQKIFQKTFFGGTVRINAMHSQPTDSLLKPMMHRSDNFFAEQSLLMVSNRLLGIMNDEKIIDTLLKTDFKDLPQKPRWADGSGLSRYNLFSPQDFVFIFNKMKNEFGMDRIRNILPTGNEGTLNNYYKAETGHLFAKTGSLSGVIALSGFLYTKKNKLVIFSVLVNNHNSSATAVRRAVEKFIENIYGGY
jgi:D-alanyl-D-alanine carboxypeptidase/D-alanyl-D-alanine-endopeptidase (penicillin-binding protein 4)